jgi:hypothetical protein
MVGSIRFHASLVGDGRDGPGLLRCSTDSPRAEVCVVIAPGWRRIDGWSTTSCAKREWNRYAAQQPRAIAPFTGVVGAQEIDTALEMNRGQVFQVWRYFNHADFKSPRSAYPPSGRSASAARPGSRLTIHPRHTTLASLDSCCAPQRTCQEPSSSSCVTTRMGWPSSTCTQAIAVVFSGSAKGHSPA